MTVMARSTNTLTEHSDLVRGETYRVTIEDGDFYLNFIAEFIAWIDNGAIFSNQVCIGDRDSSYWKCYKYTPLTQKIEECNLDKIVSKENRK